MKEVFGPKKQTYGFIATAVRINEFSKIWYGVVLDSTKPKKKQEIWRQEDGDENLFACLYAAEQQAKELRKPIEAAFERLTSGDSAEMIAGKLLEKKSLGK